MKIDFYQEVEVISSAKNKEYIGLKGVVLGISEEDGIIYGYSVILHEKECTVYFEKDDLIPTGIRFKREDFY
ncbi:MULTISPECIES: Imm31 family immunity protein [Photorhabdus]|uniref:Immunity protein 17 n=2 Tax=Photorhabdus TaxID=29487 RepID=A0A022PFG8_9GAMM|nr:MULTISPECIES: Imm31 family immunity protein [Photorhabdus]EYU13155.1 Immunity protein 17 [Photorhabdus aegyptia]MCC8459408.1 immunity protein 31 [Photorhabdus aegyptia]